MNVVEGIEEVVARESTRQSDVPLEMRIRNAISRLAGMDTSEFLKLRWFEYDIEIDSLAETDAEARLLTWLRSLEISAAPEVAASIPFGAGDGILVRRYWACPGERLIRAEPTGAPFGEVARTRFRKDMEKLVAHGKVHPFDARGFAHMLVSETSGTLLLNQWFALKPGTPCEQADFLAAIDRQLERRI